MSTPFYIFLLILAASCGIETDQFGADAKVNNRRSASDGVVLTEEAKAVVVLYVDAIESDGLALTGSRASEKQAKVFRKSLRKRLAKECGRSETNLKRIFKCANQSSVPASEDAGVDPSMDLIADFNTLPDGFVEFTSEERQEMLVVSLKAAGFGPDQIDEFMARYLEKMSEDYSDGLPSMMNHVASELDIPLDKLLKGMADNIPDQKSKKFAKKIVSKTFDLIKKEKLSAKKTDKLLKAFEKAPGDIKSNPEFAQLLETFSAYVAEKAAERPDFLPDPDDDSTESLTDRLSKLVENLVAGTIGGADDESAPKLEYPTNIFSLAVGAVVRTDPADGKFRTGKKSEITNCTVGPALPAGLDIDPKTCVISGTPTVPFPDTEFKVTVTNSKGEQDTDTITLGVAGSSPAIVYPTTTFNLMVGVTMIEQVPTVTAGIGAEFLSCAVSPDLPDGLTFDPDDCGISGTPTAAASSSHVVTLTNSHGLTATAILDHIVEANAPTVEFTEETVTIVQNVAMTPLTPSTKTNGLGANAFTCTMTSIPGLNIDDTTCVITGTPTTAATAVSVTVTHTNSLSETDTDTFDIIVASVPDLNYTETSVSLVQGTGMTPVTPSTQNDGDAATHDNCEMSPTIAGLQVHDETCAISGTPTAAMNATLVTLTHTNSFGQTDTDVITFTVASIPTLVFAETSLTLVQDSAMTPISPSNHTNGDLASHTSCAMDSVPGLSIDNDCEISGTPTTAAALATVTVTVTNSFGQTATHDIDVTVQGVPEIDYLSSSLNLNANIAMTDEDPSDGTFTAGGNASITSVTVLPSLPSGLNLHPTTGVLSGTATAQTAQATYTFTITNNHGHTDTDTIDITVNNSPTPTLAYGVTAISAVNGVNQATINPTTFDAGPTASVDNCSVAPPLPNGIDLNVVDCSIAVEPLAAQSQTTHTITLLNDLGNTDTFDIDVTVVNSIPDIEYGVTSISAVNGVNQAVVTPTTLDGGPSASVDNCTVAPPLPNGIDLNVVDCSIAVEPLAAQSQTTHTITLLNDLGNTDTFDIDVTVVNSIPDIEYGVTSISAVNGVNQAVVSPTTLDGGPSASADNCTVAPPLPNGIDLNVVDCSIAVEPLAAQSQTTHTITLLNDLGNTDTFDIDVTVVNSIPDIEYGVTSISAVNGVNQAVVSPTTLDAGPSASVDNCTVSPPLPNGIDLNVVDCSIAVEPLAAQSQTTHTITLLNDLGNTDTFDIDVTVVNSIPDIEYGVTSISAVNGVNQAVVSPTTLDAGPSASVDNCTVSPPLPNGIDLNVVDCSIAVEPLAAQSQTTHTITLLNDLGNTDTFDIDVTVASVPTVVFAQTSLTLVEDTAMTSISPSSHTNGDLATHTSFSMSPAVPGLSINSTTGEISGTPTAGAALTTVTMTKTNSFGQTGTHDIDITVEGVPEIDYVNSALTLNVGAAMTAEDPSNGTFAVGGNASSPSVTVSPSLPAGLSLHSTNGTVSGTPTGAVAQATYTFTITNNHGHTDTDTIDITVDNVAQPTLVYASDLLQATMGGSFTTEVPLTTGTLDPGSGAWYDTCSISPTPPSDIWFDTYQCEISHGTLTEPLARTTYTVTFTNDQAQTDTDTIDIEILPSQPTLVYASDLLQATMGGSFTTEVPLTTGTLDPGAESWYDSCSISPTPPSDIWFDGYQCEISHGTLIEPLARTTYTVTFTNMHGQTDTDTIDIEILPSQPTLVYASDLLQATMGGSFTTEVPLSTGTLDPGAESWYDSCSISPTPPSDIWFDGYQCEISHGTLIEPLARTTYTVTFTNMHGQTDTDTIDIEILPSQPTLVYASDLLQATMGGSFTTEVPLSTGTLDPGAESWYDSCSISPTPPSDIWFDGYQCEISHGTLIEPLARTTYTVTFTNMHGQTDTDTIDIEILPSQPTLVYASDLLQATMGGSFTTEVPLSTGTLDPGAESWYDSCSISPTPPGDIWFDGYQCEISHGTLVEPLARTTYTVTFTNTHGQTDTDTIDIEILPSQPTLVYASDLLQATMGGSFTTEVPLSTGTLDPGAESWYDSCSISPTPPSDIWFDGYQCEISHGTLTEPLARTTYTVTFTNTHGQTDTDTIDIEILPSQPTLVYASDLLQATVGGSFTTEVPLSTGTIDPGAESWYDSCSISPTPPAQIWFDTYQCEISHGTLGAALARTTYTVTFTNTHGQTDTDTIDIEILAGGSPLATFDLDTASDFDCDGAGDCASSNTIAIGSGAAAHNTRPDIKTNTAAEWNAAGATLDDVTVSSDTLVLNSTGNTAWSCDESWTPEWDDLVICYDFEEASGAAINLKNPGTYNGTWAGDAGRTTSVYRDGGKAATFDGTGDYLDTGYLINTTGGNGMTFMMWVKTDDPGGRIYYAGASAGDTDDHFEMHIDNGNNGSAGNYARSSTGNYNAASSSDNLDNNEWHHVAVTFDPSGSNKMKVFIDGLWSAATTLSGYSAWDFTPTGETLYIGGLNDEGVLRSGPFNGQIDGVMIWETALSGGNIRKVMMRQHIAYSGVYTSEVFDLGYSTTLGSLSWNTTHPFGKAVPGSSGDELVSVYSGLVDSTGASGDSDLSTGLLAYYDMDDVASTISDSSGNSQDSTAITGTIYNWPHGGVGQSAYLDGHAVLGDLTTGGSISVSMWINPANDFTTSGNHTIIGEGSDDEWQIEFAGSNQLRLNIMDSSGWKWTNTLSSSIPNNQWTHVVAVFSPSLSGDKYRMYINGVEDVTSSDYNSYSIVDDTGEVLSIGAWPDGSRAYNGLIDEVGIWNRALVAEEVLEIYRRGANRIHVQARTCSDSSCATPVTDWFGPGGTGTATYFSEFYNSDAHNAGNNYNPTGNVLLTQPYKLLSSYTAPSDGRYWQYRVLMESLDTGGACSGSSTCNPVMESFSMHDRVGDVVGGTEVTTVETSYFVNDTAISFSSLTSLDVSDNDTSACGYQMSPDNGTTYYYHNGSAWATATTSAHVNASNDTALDDLSGFPAGSGQLIVKVYMIEGATACSVSSLEVNGSN